MYIYTPDVFCSHGITTTLPSLQNLLVFMEIIEENNYPARSYLLLDLNCNNVSQKLYEARYDVNLKTFQLGCLVYILQVLVFSIGLTTMI